MLKKFGILGIAGIMLAGGLGLAGCAGTSLATSGVPNDAKVAESEEIVTEEAVGDVVEESDDGFTEEAEEITEYGQETGYSNAGDEASSSAGDIDVKEVDGKYVYTILDGRVEVPLDTRIEDYIGTWVERSEDIENVIVLNTYFEVDDDLCFDVDALAENLGWTRKYRYGGEYHCFDDDGEEIRVKSDGSATPPADFTDIYDSPSGQRASKGFGVYGKCAGGVTFYRGGEPPHSTTYIDKCIYETSMDGAISYDHAVLLTYVFENARGSQAALHPADPSDPQKGQISFLLEPLFQDSGIHPTKLYELYEY